MDQEFINRMNVCSDIVGSQAALARLSSISQSGIRRYYQGGDPTRTVLIALASASGVSLIWLASGLGPACDLSSPALILAKQELVNDFKLTQHQVGRQNLLLSEAGNLYCDEYNHGNFSASLPSWVSVVIPKLNWGELADWFQGNLTTQPKCLLRDKGESVERQTDGWLLAPSDLVVVVARELQLAFGDGDSTPDLQKEAYALRSVVDFLLKQSGEVRESFMRPELLRTQIQLAAHMYDQNRKRQQSNETTFPWTPGNY